MKNKNSIQQLGFVMAIPMSILFALIEIPSVFFAQLPTQGAMLLGSAVWMIPVTVGWYSHLKIRKTQISLMVALFFTLLTLISLSGFVITTMIFSALAVNAVLSVVLFIVFTSEYFKRYVFTLK